MSSNPEVLSESAAAIVDRKRSHFDLCAHQDVEFRRKTTLFEDVELVHQPLTETALDGIDLGVRVMGKQLSFPVVITGMSGGTEETGRFNRDIAAVADRMGIGFGVGSQRVMLTRPEVKETFQVRGVAPNVLLLGNIGIAQARTLGSRELRGLIEDIQADALCVHLNTPMEIIQEKGDHDFRGSLKAIAGIVDELGSSKVIIKETGCGFARETGRRLAEVGVKWIDVSGAGGTSWVGVETLRHRALRHLGEAFWDWGIPTAASVCELRDLNLELIASGGMRTGMEAAKALALGARLVGVALPVLRAYVEAGADGVETFLRAFRAELRAAVMLCGCARLEDLTPKQAVIGGRLLEWATQRGLPVANARPGISNLR
ncbi:MAG TPA: type 2 isopentenyl-diphosphate Delta-isomerase [Blastocatellia bacterium]|nr:type 2 isopentenyl-diphosphate Delta-isomerase [Blastocatellia bacterium]